MWKHFFLGSTQIETKGYNYLNLNLFETVLWWSVFQRSVFNCSPALPIVLPAKPNARLSLWRGRIASGRPFKKNITSQWLKQLTGDNVRQSGDKLRKLPKDDPASNKGPPLCTKGLRRAAFPRLMNADKVRADNQTGRTKGISLSEAFHSDLSNGSERPLIGGRLTKECQQKKKKKEGTLHRAPPPTRRCLPCLPSLPAPGPPPFSLSPSPLVASRLAVTHLAPPGAHSRRSVCEEGQEFRPGWGLRPSLCTVEARPCGFIIICRWHSAQVQAQCKRWHQRGGMRLATHLVISCP